MALRAGLALAAALAAVGAHAPGPPAFVRHVLAPGAFGQVVDSVAAGDLDGDLRPEAVVAGERYLLWYPRPDGPPRLIARGVFGAGAAVAVRDLDGDRRPDVITGETSQPGGRREVWFANTPSGWRRHVLAERSYCHDLAFVPMRRPQVVCIDQFAERIGLLAPGAAVTAPWSYVPVAEGVVAMGAAVADLDRDGRLDVVAGRSWYRVGADGRWERRAYTTATGPLPEFDDFAKLAVLDVDGDRRLDVVAALFAESPAGALLVFHAPPDPLAGGWTWSVLDNGPLFGVHGLAAARFDGCARPELAVGETNVGGWDFGPAPDPHVYLYRRLASGWSRTVVDAVGAHDLTAADLDGDGRPDLLGHEENTDRASPPRNGRVFWWRNVTLRGGGC